MASAADPGAVAHYRRDGYLVVRRVLSRDHVEGCLSALAALATDAKLISGQRGDDGAFIALEPGAGGSVGTEGRAHLIRKFGDFIDTAPALLRAAMSVATARDTRRADGSGAGAAAGDGAGEAAESQWGEALASGRRLFPRQRPQPHVRRLDRTRPRDAAEWLHGGDTRFAPPWGRHRMCRPRTSISARSVPISCGLISASRCRWSLAMCWCSTA